MFSTDNATVIIRDEQYAVRKMDPVDELVWEKYGMFAWGDGVKCWLICKGDGDAIEIDYHTSQLYFALWTEVGCREWRQLGISVDDLAIIRDALVLYQCEQEDAHIFDQEKIADLVTRVSSQL
jgi:hypothetical protein